MLKKLFKNYNIKKIISYSIKNNRKREFKNFKNSKSIIMMYEINDLDSVNAINKLIDKLRENPLIIDIKTLGYYNENTDPSFLSVGSKYNFFNKKDLNYTGIPTKNEEVIFLINQEYDILIDFSISFNIPIHYVVAKSKSKFKLGRNFENSEVLFDFIINIDKSINEYKYIELIQKYLTNIEAK